MSVPGGGFSFPISFNIQQALERLQTLAAAGGQAVQSIGQMFASVTPTLNTSGVINQLNQVNQTAQNLRSLGTIRINLISDGADQALQKFQALSKAASALAHERYTVNLTLNSATLESGLVKAREIVSTAAQGQAVNLTLNLSEEEALRSFRELEREFKAAEARGVKINVTVDAEAAKREAQRAADDIQRRSGKVVFSVVTEGAQVTASQLRQLDEIGRQISRRPVNFNIQVDPSNARAVERFRQQIQLLQTGDNATVYVKGNPNHFRAVFNQVDKDIKEAERRGANISITADARQFNSVLQGILGGAGRGFIAGSGLSGNLLVGAGSLTMATAPIIAAAVAVQGLTQATGAAIQSSIAYNRVLEQTNITLVHLTQSAGTASKFLTDMRKLADISPFGDQQIIAAGQAFLRVSQGDVERAKQLTELTTALAAAHPELGFEAMQLAIQQLISGDYRAFEDRTNIAIGTVRELARTGLYGMDLYRAAVERAGGSLELLHKQNQTFTARLTAAQSAIQGINAAIGEGFFQGLVGLLGEINSVLVDHRAGWEYLARSMGQTGAIIAGFPILWKPLLAVLNEVGKALEIIDRLQKKQADEQKGPESMRVPEWISQPTEEEKKAAVAAREARLQAQQAVRNDLERTSGVIQTQTQEVKNLEMQHSAVERVVKNIQLLDEQRLTPLRNQIAQIEKMNVALEKQVLFNQMAQAGARQRLEDAQGDPQQRAELAGLLAVQQREQELIQIRHRRAQLNEDVAQRERAIARRVAEAQLEVREAAIGRLRDEHQANQEVRQAALERLREEVRGHQEARQAALDKLREEIQAQQEARRTALEGLREQVRAQQEARREALDGLREEISARQEARREAIEGLQEEIRTRREAYQELRELEREAREEAERAYDERRRAEEQQFRAEQEGRRRQIEALRQRDQDLRRQESGELPAERELKALEQANRERERAQTLANAERAVGEARTSREWRAARERLQQLRVQQAAEAEREAIQERIRQQREAREEAQQRRQEQIQALEMAAREEDRRYEEQRRIQDEAHRKQQAAIQAQERAEEKAERARQRAEDAQVREQEKIDRELRKQEEAQVKAAEKADRELQKQEEAAIRQAEAAARAADKADQAKVKEAERAAREADKQEQANLREQERIARELDRQEQAKIRKEERDLDNERRRLAKAQREEDDKRDIAMLGRIKEARDAELKILETRERVLKLQDAQAIQIATRDFTLAQLLGTTLTTAQTIDGIIKRLTTLDFRAQIEAIMTDTATRIEPIKRALNEIEIKLNNARSKLDILTAQKDQLQREVDALAKPGAGEQPRQGPAAPGSEGPSIWGQIGALVDPRILFDRNAEGSPAWALAETIRLAKEAIAGFTSQFSTDTTAQSATEDWSQRSVAAAFGPWKVASPSEVTSNLAYEIAQGFILQMNYQAEFIAASVTDAFTVAIDPSMATENAKNAAFSVSDSFIQQMNFQSEFMQQSMRAPFEEFLYRWLPGVPEYYTDTASKSADALAGASQSDIIGAALRAPFEEFLYNWLPGVPQFYYDVAASSATALVAGYTSTDLGQVLRAPFEYHLQEWMPGVPQFYYDTAVASVTSWTAGYATPEDLSLVLRRPFEYHLNEWMPGVAPQYYDFAAEANKQWTDGYATPQDLSITMREPFEYMLKIWLPGVPPQFFMNGHQAAAEWGRGFQGYPWAIVAQNSMNAVKAALNLINPTFEAYGRAAASYFAAGWRNFMSLWVPPLPTMQTPSTSSSGQSRPSTTTPPSSSGGPWYFTGRYDGRGWPIYGKPSTGELQAFPPGVNPNSGGSPTGSRPSIYHSGVDYVPRTGMAMLQQGEAIISAEENEKLRRQLGMATPSRLGSFLGESATSVAQRAPVPAVSSNVYNMGNRIVNLDINQTINAGGITDPDTFARKITDQTVAAVIDVLDVTQQQTATPVSRLLPGAL